MSLQGKIIDLCDQIQKADRKGVKKLFEIALAELDWETYGFVSHVISKFQRTKGLFESNYSLAWLANYKFRGFYEIDPIVAHCMTSNQPLIWSTAAEEWLEYPDNVQKFIESCRKFGFTGGVAVPAHTLFCRGLISFTTDRPLDEKLDAIENAKVFGKLLGTNLHDALFRIQFPDWVSLTPREHEVLQYVADGFTSKEIAWEIGLKETSVLFHITNAQKKLQAKTRQELVAKAYSLGMLSIRLSWDDESILNRPGTDGELNTYWERVTGGSPDEIPADEQVDDEGTNGS